MEALIVNKLRLGFLASHGGSNLQAIIDACKIGELDAKPCIIISNNNDSKALQRAEKENIPYYRLSGKTHPIKEELDEEILNVLLKYNVDLIILAGYMKKIGIKTLNKYRGKILNIHPALLPKYGGKGMYGDNVHSAVLESGDTVTGVTIHVIDEKYDNGPIVDQVEVPIYETDDVESLKARVLEKEHKFFVKTLKKITEGQIMLGEERPHFR